jgi:hypothetical protein
MLGVAATYDARAQLANEIPAGKRVVSVKVETGSARPEPGDVVTLDLGNGVRVTAKVFATSQNVERDEVIRDGILQASLLVSPRQVRQLLDSPHTPKVVGGARPTLRVRGETVKQLQPGITELELPLNDQIVLAFPEQVSSFGRPDQIRMVNLADNRLLLIGDELGRQTIVFSPTTVDRPGEEGAAGEEGAGEGGDAEGFAATTRPRDLYVLKVSVVPDTAPLVSTIHRLFPKEKIELIALPSGNTVMLRGTVSDAHSVEVIVAVAEEAFPRVINNLTVGRERSNTLDPRRRFLESLRGQASNRERLSELPSDEARYSDSRKSEEARYSGSLKSEKSRNLYGDTGGSPQYSDSRSSDHPRYSKSSSSEPKRDTLVEIRDELRALRRDLAELTRVLGRRNSAANKATSGNSESSPVDDTGGDEQGVDLSKGPAGDGASDRSDGAGTEGAAPFDGGGDEAAGGDVNTPDYNTELTPNDVGRLPSNLNPRGEKRWSLTLAAAQQLIGGEDDLEKLVRLGFLSPNQLAGQRRKLLGDVNSAYWSIWKHQISTEMLEQHRARARQAWQECATEDGPLWRRSFFDLRDRQAKEQNQLLAARARLRSLLSLPETDGRYIYATTTPADELYLPAWEELRQAGVERSAEHQKLVARRIRTAADEAAMNHIELNIAHNLAERLRDLHAVQAGLRTDRQRYEAAQRDWASGASTAPARVAQLQRSSNAVLSLIEHRAEQTSAYAAIVEITGHLSTPRESEQGDQVVTETGDKVDSTPPDDIPPDARF